MATPILARFQKSADAVSAIEFAMVFPVMLILMLGGGQLILYVNATRKVQQIATSVSEMLSQAAPTSPSDTSATVNATDLNFSYDASLVIFPYVMTDARQRNVSWRSALTVSFAGISFTKLRNDCDGQADLSGCYLATVKWTSTGTSTASYRPCLLPQTAANDAAPYSNANLPRSVFGPGSIVAVDVSYTFRPTFGSAFLAPISITRSAFVQPRYVTSIDFDTTGNDGIASKCLIPS